MDTRLPLLEGNRQRGEVLCRQDGLRTLFIINCPRWDDGIHKVWLAGKEGSLLLGTLMPEGQSLTLRRALSNASLARGGVAVPELGVIDPDSAAPPARRNREELLSLLEDEPIRQSAEQCQNLRWQREAGGLRITVPWRPGQPFPLLPLFCFAAWERGQIIYRLTEKGYPRNISGQTGNTDQ